MELLLKDVSIINFTIEDDGTFPNNSSLPVVIYKNTLYIDDEEENADRFESIFRSNKWAGSWRDGIYDYHHYHSTAHEVLGINGGTADVQLGGPKGSIYRVSKGDVIIIPAGVAHKNLGSDSNFWVVGAYPEGQDWDVKYGDVEERPLADTNIVKVPLPKLDPFFGSRKGFLIDLWKLDF